MKELSGLMSTGRWRIVISFHIVDIFVYPLITCMHTFSKRQTDDLFFLMFPRKIGSKLHTNCLQNLLKCQNYFLEKKRKKKQNKKNNKKKQQQSNKNKTTATKKKNQNVVCWNLYPFSRRQINKFYHIMQIVSGDNLNEVLKPTFWKN